MTAVRVPLGILDLVPIVSGSGPNQALCNALDLVQVAEQLGYQRYWFAEHHLNPGVAGSAPALLIAMAGAQTEHIRLGSGGVQSGHRTALSVVEEFGLLDAMYPGRVDLGIGRSGGRAFFRDKLARVENGGRNTRDGEKAPPRDRHTENGLLIPAAPSLRHLASAPRITLTAEMLQQQDAKSPEYEELVEDILGLVDGSYRSKDGLDPRPVPGAGAQVEPWILGSSPGESAAVAGRLGLRFAASYHISPASALERGACLPGGVRSFHLAGTALRGSLRRRRRGAGRRDSAAPGCRICALGAQHPLWRGCDPVSGSGGSCSPRMDLRGRSAGARSRGEPICRLAGDCGPRSRTSPGSSASGRDHRDDHCAQPFRPGAVLRPSGP